MCYGCKKQQSCRRRQGESVEKLNLVLQYLIEKVDYLEDLIGELHDEEDIETVSFSDRESCSSRNSDSECELGDDECARSCSSSQNKSRRRGERNNGNGNGNNGANRNRSKNNRSSSRENNNEECPRCGHED